MPLVMTNLSFAPITPGKRTATTLSLSAIFIFVAPVFVSRCSPLLLLMLLPRFVHLYFGTKIVRRIKYGVLEAGRIRLLHGQMMYFGSSIDRKSEAKRLSHISNALLVSMVCQTSNGRSPTERESRTKKKHRHEKSATKNKIDYKIYGNEKGIEKSKRWLSVRRGRKREWEQLMNANVRER